MKPVLIAGCLALLAAPGCGRKGPPLPPLVRLPVAPEELSAARRGDSVEIAFVVPAANTDKTRPANVARVDVYALTTTARVSAPEVVDRGERVASVEVKAPRDPNRTIDPGDPASDLQPLEGPGLDQGTATEVFEALAGSAPPAATDAGPVPDGWPLAGPPCLLPTRAYVGVGISVQGRRGPLSRLASVPLGDAPGAPSRPALKYDEAGVTVAWAADPADPAGGGEPGEERLAARPIGCSAPAVGYHVYEVGDAPFETRLTTEPVPGAPFVDPRVEWGAERCYAVRAVHTIGALSLESEPSPPACEKLVDTFPPAAPQGLVAVASQGAINLIWDASPARDLAGYVVLRAPAATKAFAAVNADPVRDTTFTDKVPSGTPFVYAILAVDAAGNRSAASAPSPPESAR